jgi:hypothetical protein
MLEKHAVFIALVLVSVLALAPALYAEQSSTPQNSTMSPEMMGDNGMMIMMQSMSQMEGMMDHCSQMMNGGMGGGSDRPNEQW